MRCLAAAVLMFCVCAPRAEARQLPHMRPHVVDLCPMITADAPRISVTQQNGELVVIASVSGAGSALEPGMALSRFQRQQGSAAFIAEAGHLENGEFESEASFAGGVLGALVLCADGTYVEVVPFEQRVTLAFLPTRGAQSRWPRIRATERVESMASGPDTFVRADYVWRTNRYSRRACGSGRGERTVRVRTRLGKAR